MNQKNLASERGGVNALWSRLIDKHAVIRGIQGSIGRNFIWDACQRPENPQTLGQGKKNARAEGLYLRGFSQFPSPR